LVVRNTEEGTLASISEMDETALIFEKNGIKVSTFYDKNTNWEAIKKVAKTASFFVYSGHGSTMGINGRIGGLCLNNMISSQQIIAELKLKKNALVLFRSVCRGAGSSALDTKDIGREEALKRVGDYAQPFFAIGAACYYADNFGGGVDLFLTEFLSGRTIAECYDISIKASFVMPEISKIYRPDTEKQIAVSSTIGSGSVTYTSYNNGVKTVKEIPSFKGYDIAFVGKPRFTIKEMSSFR